MKYTLTSIIMLCALMFASIASAATALSISTTNLPAATVSTPFSITLLANGGTAPYSWTVCKAPAGLTINNAGVLSGTPKIAGSSDLQITVKDSKNKTASKTLALTVAKAISLTLTPSLPGPQISGLNPIVFKAGIVNTTGNYEYQFEYVDPVYPTLQLVAQPYSTSNVWTMNTAFSPNVYKITVKARLVGNATAYDYLTTTSYTITVPPPAKTVTLTSSVPSPQMSGKHVTFDAIAGPLPNYFYNYKYTITGPDGAETILMDFSSYFTPTWNSFGQPAGNYIVKVYARQAYATTGYDVVKQMAFTLTPSTVKLPTTDPDKFGKVLTDGADNHYVFGGLFISKFDTNWNLIWKKAITAGDGKFDKDGNIVFYSGGFKKIDPAGNIIKTWTTVLPFTADALYIDASENVYVAGRKMVSGSTTVHVQKYDANGSLQLDWTASPNYVIEPIGCHNGAWVAITGITADEAGNIYVAGNTTSSNQQFVGVAGGFVISFDAIGNQLANVSLPGGAGKLFKSADGNFVTIGEELAATAGNNAPATDITKFAADGTILWQKKLQPSYNGLSLIRRDVVQNSSGNLYILSSPTYSATPKVLTNEFTGVAVTKIDTEGNIVQAVTGGVTLEEWITPSALGVDDAGNAFVKTVSDLPTGTYNALLKFNVEGKQDWLK
jgi:hypothetical protein